MNLSHSFTYAREPETTGRQLSVQIAVTAQAVEELRPIWNTWKHLLDTNIDYYLQRLRNDSTILHPYVITVQNGDTIQTMVVGVVRKQRMSAVVAFINVSGPQAKVLEIEKGSIFGLLSSRIDRLLALQFSQALSADHVDFLCFGRFPLASGLILELQKLVDLKFKRRSPHVFYDRFCP